MKISKVDLIFPDFRTIADVDWDDGGFRERGSSDPVAWTDIVQVALIYEMSPTLAIVEPDTYIGFRLSNPKLTVWVYSTWEDAFAKEIGVRFAPLSVPRVADWKESKRSVVSYSIWPESQSGEPLYVNVRTKWWSSEALMAFRPT